MSNGLTAWDNFKENYTTVLINVRDVNDNPPVFKNRHIAHKSSRRATEVCRNECYG
ncbi:putative neural-cadherin 2 [Anopheles merus]|uniref:putative neural-cadherin 2 n=1 Tax=Anopheles merus TaxID=30066 RepID=UPI001BE49DCA|nr:putative neural-cadherin 2 [Anopheles merus]